MNCKPLTPFQNSCHLADFIATLRKMTPLCVLFLMTEWSQSEFVFQINSASNQARKQKLHGIHIIELNWNQHCTDDNCNPLTLFQIACYPVLLKWCIQRSHKAQVAWGSYNSIEVKYYSGESKISSLVWTISYYCDPSESKIILVRFMWMQPHILWQQIHIHWELTHILWELVNYLRSLEWIHFR